MDEEDRKPMGVEVGRDELDELDELDEEDERPRVFLMEEVDSDDTGSPNVKVKVEEVELEDDKRWYMKVDELESVDEAPGNVKMEEVGLEDERKVLEVVITTPKRQMAKSNRGRRRSSRFR